LLKAEEITIKRCINMFHVDPETEKAKARAEAYRKALACFGEEKQQ
jgi:hypothetical protein